MRPRVKFCGMTRASDAHAAIQLGVDALGFIFHPSSARAVDVTQAQAITQSLPPLVARVGVFVDHSLAQIQQIAAQAQLTVIQLHGDQSPEFCQQLHLPVIKAIAVTAQTDIAQVVAPYLGAAQILLDTHHPTLAGGSGQTFAWSQIPHSLCPHIILAGGLTPDNVAQAIRTVTPYAVDVSSGIEDRPGCKNPVKMTQFMTQVTAGQQGQ
jgi:phosphoribosylanthranilate isomerase